MGRIFPDELISSTRIARGSGSQLQEQSLLTNEQQSTANSMVEDLLSNPSYCQDEDKQMTVSTRGQKTGDGQKWVFDGKSS